MPPETPAPQLAAMVGKWCELALKRRAHFVDLYDSGRWRHYYTGPEFVAELHKLTQMIERWKAIAGDARLCERASAEPPARDAA